MLPPTAEDQTPGALLLLAVGFGMAALLLKVLHEQICPWLDFAQGYPHMFSTLQRHQVFVPQPRPVSLCRRVCVQVKACAWAGVVCIVMCVANINSAELDVKSIMSAGS